MNWDAVGAAGEVLGAIAVFVTLAYLAIQIKQNSSVAKAQLNSWGFDAFSKFRAMQNDSADVVARMLMGEPLTGADEVIAQNILTEGLFAAAAGYKNSKVIDPSRCDDFVLIGVGFVDRFRWPSWESSRNSLDRAGFSDFSEQVALRLEQE